MMDLKSSDMEYRDSLEKSCSPCEECLKDDDKQVKFYTGLLPSFVSLMAVFRLVSLHVSCPRSSLPPFQQFLLV